MAKRNNRIDTEVIALAVTGLLLRHKTRAQARAKPFETSEIFKIKYVSQ